MGVSFSAIIGDPTDLSDFLPSEPSKRLMNILNKNDYNNIFRLQNQNMSGFRGISLKIAGFKLNDAFFSPKHVKLHVICIKTSANVTKYICLFSDF